MQRRHPAAAAALTIANAGEAAISAGAAATAAAILACCCLRLAFTRTAPAGKGAQGGRRHGVSSEPRQQWARRGATAGARG